MLCWDWGAHLVMWPATWFVSCSVWVKNGILWISKGWHFWETAWWDFSFMVQFAALLTPVVDMSQMLKWVAVSVWRMLQPNMVGCSPSGKAFRVAWQQALPASSLLAQPTWSRCGCKWTGGGSWKGLNPGMGSAGVTDGHAVWVRPTLLLRFNVRTSPA